MARSTCDHTVERLPWWLNGTLEEGEARSVEAHLADCPACADELAATREALGMYALHLPIETLLDRVEDAAAASYRTADGAILSRRAVENHLEHCPSCREEVALLRASRAAIGDDSSLPTARVTAFAPRSPRAAPRAAPRSAPRSARRRGLDRRSLALAASLVLFAIAAGGWLLTGRLAEERGDRLAELESRLAIVSDEPAVVVDDRRDEDPAGRAESETEAERLARLVAELEREVEIARRMKRPPVRLADAIGVGPTFSWRLADPVLRGAGTPADGEGLAVPAGAENVSLFIEEVGEGPLRLRIDDASGRRLLERDDLRPFDHPLLGRHLTITLPVDDLPAGPLRLRLFEGDREVGSLVLRVER